MMSDGFRDASRGVTVTVASPHPISPPRPALPGLGWSRQPPAGAFRLHVSRLEDGMESWKVLHHHLGKPWDFKWEAPGGTGVV